MKTFGDIKVGDVMYSLNHIKFGVLTEHTVTEVKHSKHQTFIRIKGYYDPYYDHVDDEIYDLKIRRRNSATIDEVAPSVEGVKQYWIDDHTYRIKEAMEKIERVNPFISLLQKDIEKINSIK